MFCCTDFFLYSFNVYAGNPPAFVSHLPIHQDGSCNGLQHYAALGRDEEGGKEVNLLPTEKPSDVYSSVATRYDSHAVLLCKR